MPAQRLPLAARSFHFCLFSWMYLDQVARKLAMLALMSPSSVCSSTDGCRHWELQGEERQPWHSGLAQALTSP